MPTSESCLEVKLPFSSASGLRLNAHLKLAPKVPGASQQQVGTGARKGQDPYIIINSILIIVNIFIRCSLLPDSPSDLVYCMINSKL